MQPISILNNIPNHGGDLNKLMHLVHNVTLEYDENPFLQIRMYSIISILTTPVKLNFMLTTLCIKHVSLRRHEDAHY